MILDAEIFNNTNYKLVLVLLYSLFATFVAATYLKRKFNMKGFTVKDMYKKDKTILANLGGTAALIGILTAIVLSQVIVYEFSTANLLIFFFITIIHSLFGLIDDLINTSNLIKIVAPYFMALPVFLLVNSSIVNIGPYSIDLGLWFVYLIAPIYLLVVTNLINMHSGYNGLSSGLSWIIILALGIRSVLLGNVSELFYLMPIFGALSALWFFDRYPARMIWGNVGSMLVGSAIGAYMIISRAELFGIIILIPHIMDFLLYLYSQIVQRKKFEKIKFGRLRKDGTLEVPTPFKMKFLLPYYFRLTEKQTVNYLYLITAVFCVIGLILGV